MKGRMAGGCAGESVRLKRPMRPKGCARTGMTWRMGGGARGKNDFGGKESRPSEPNERCVRTRFPNSSPAGTSELAELSPTLVHKS
jgi:hypothetical protein